MNNFQKQQFQDRNVINYLEMFKVAKTDTLATLFFSNLLMAQRRLKKLSTDYRIISRDRDYITQQYYYYLSKPRQLKHSLLLTDFHREIVKLGIKIVSFENEFAYFESIRPDAFLAYEYKGKKRIAFIETELSNRPNMQKYEKFYKFEEWKKAFPIFPKIIWVTNRKIPNTDLTIIHLKEDLSNIHLLCRD